MRISASGVLLRAAERLDRTRDMKHLAFGLRQLYEHLKELKRLGEIENSAACRQMFEIWTDLDKDCWQ